MTFIQFCESHGLVIRSLKIGEKIQRCGTREHPKSTNGAYLFDGRRGGCMAWDAGGKWYWFNDPNAKPYSDEEKRAWAMRQREAEAERERAYANAAKQADIVLRSCEQKTHGYLKQKGFIDRLAHVDADDVLHIPMRDWQTNRLRGTQRIFWADERWQKKMTHGMQAKGAVLRIGGLRARETWLVEGFATGLSVHAALGSLDANVVCCFSDSNLVHVASVTTGTRYVFADNDESGAGERAALATKLPYVMAPTVGHDANDWHVSAGIFAVKDAILKKRRETC
jgi:phage/plasmid primase-like uncharacterized protein